jgi:citrate lyase subunit beta/citryl-CoA lyase
MADEDLEWTVQPGLAGIVLPKVESASDVRRFADTITNLENKREIGRDSIKLMPILESAKGVLAAQEIAAADPRVVALAFGALDFTRDMGIHLTREGYELQYARSYIAIVARATGILAIDTPCIDLADPERLAVEAKSGRDLGFRGKLLIHPAQVSIVNQVFSPAEDEVSYARKIVEAFYEAERQGFGAISLDGKMIDIANCRQAEELIALADSLAGKEKNQG